MPQPAQMYKIRTTKIRLNKRHLFFTFLALPIITLGVLIFIHINTAKKIAHLKSQNQIIVSYHPNVTDFLNKIPDTKIREYLKNWVFKNQAYFQDYFTNKRFNIVDLIISSSVTSKTIRTLENLNTDSIE
ncbi:MAG: hypothetical protein AAF191_13240, partial [Verrucomicrobiota bacterium]